MDTSAITVWTGTSGCVSPSGSHFKIRYAVDATDNCTSVWKSTKYSDGKVFTWGDLEEAWYDGAVSIAAMSHELSSGKEYMLPDGSRLIIDSNGNYRIDDKDAKVTYKANRIREFSPHLNASDMVAKFLEYAGSLGVRKGEVMGLPISLFISWLIIETAERDGDELPPEVRPIAHDPHLRQIVKPQCLKCGRYIKHLHARNRFPFCSPIHGAEYIERQRALVLSQAM